MAELDQLQNQLQTAAAKGDWKQVIELGSQLKKAQNEADREKQEANKGAIEELRTKAKSRFVDLAKKLEAQIVELVGVDKARVKFDFDFQNELDVQFTITKGTGTSGKRSGGGGGTPQRYEKSTHDLLSAYGGEPFQKNGEPSGQTLQEAWDADTSGNHRFNVRKQLIKHDLGK